MWRATPDAASASALGVFFFTASVSPLVTLVRRPALGLAVSRVLAERVVLQVPQEPLAIPLEPRRDVARATAPSLAREEEHALGPGRTVVGDQLRVDLDDVGARATPTAAHRRESGGADDICREDVDHTPSLICGGSASRRPYHEPPPQRNPAALSAPSTSREGFSANVTAQ